MSPVQLLTKDVSHPCTFNIESGCDLTDEETIILSAHYFHSPFSNICVLVTCANHTGLKPVWALTKGQSHSAETSELEQDKGIFLVSATQVAVSR